MIVKINLNDDQYKSLKMYFTILQLTKQQVLEINIQDLRAKIKMYEKLFLNESTKDGDKDFNLIDDYKKEIAEAKTALKKLKEDNSPIKTQEKTFKGKHKHKSK